MYIKMPGGVAAVLNRSMKGKNVMPKRPAPCSDRSENKISVATG